MYIRKAASPTPCESLWEALGLGEKVLKKPFHIAAVGSGGKTTLLYTLAREARERGLSVLLPHDSYAASGKGRRTHRQGGGCD
ncbi:MAG: hypothetical protein ACLR2E_20085 [Lachnospiraceae bacterium]